MHLIKERIQPKRARIELAKVDRRRATGNRLAARRLAEPSAAPEESLEKIY
jgi:hypothetical protein